MVATGTGSGKAEAFLMPIIDHCLRVAAPDTLKAILVCPMNALANDRRDRIRKLLAGTSISFGVYTGETRQWGRRPEGIPENERLMRSEFRAHPPEILLTNYRMLEYLLLRGDGRALFRNHAVRFIVLDEVHTYKGALGTDVAGLIPSGPLGRRLGRSATGDWNCGAREADLVDQPWSEMGLPSDGDGGANGTRPEGFRMCPTCGDMVRLVVQPKQQDGKAPRRGRKQTNAPQADQDPHAKRCHGDPRPVTLGQQAKADTLRLLVEGMEEQGEDGVAWAWSIGTALLEGARRHFELDDDDLDVIVQTAKDADERTGGKLGDCWSRMGRFGQGRVNLLSSPGLGVARQLARFVGRTLKTKDLGWLPERDIARNLGRLSQRDTPASGSVSITFDKTDSKRMDLASERSRMR